MTKNRFLRFALLLIVPLVFLFAGCPSWWSHRPSDNLNSYVGAGFQIVYTPSRYYSPGKILRVKDDISYEVTDLAAGNNLSVRSFPEEIGNIVQNSKGSFSAGFVFGPVANAGFNLTDTYSLEFKAGGVERCVTSDIEVDPVVKKAMQGVEWKNGYRYYVVREAVSATEMDFKFNTTMLAQCGGDGKINSLVSARGNLSWNPSGSYQLKNTFSQPLYIFYKVEELTPCARTRSIYPVDQEFERRLVTEPVHWKEGATSSMDEQPRRSE